MLVRIKSNRFGEGWKIGEIVGMDDEAARVPLENGEVEIYEPTVTIEEAGFKCEICGKVCKTKAALAGHRRSHK